MNTVKQNANIQQIGKFFSHKKTKFNENSNTFAHFDI
jgi:hypothetical protein